ncbi:helix-turn-helix domain-containing protein [Pediococcus pentosaceus]|uniref:helix-turn-helix domain-containing protein n=1 Tax=Pediococcus pentosaceus TaxID=1255 RepID=UPI003981A6BC
MKTLKIKNPAKLRDRIAMNGETLTSFSSRVGIELSMLSNYLNEKKRLSPTTAKKIADGVGLDMHEIFLP